MIGIRSSSSFEDYHDRKRADISRLLDPSYNTSYYRSTEQRPTYGAYVDAQGDLHDPDYRQFPLIQHANNSKAHHPHRYNYYSSAAGATRPHCELVDEDAALVFDDDEDLLLQDTYSAKRHSYSSSTTRFPGAPKSPLRSSSPSGGNGMRVYTPTKGLYASSGAVLSPSAALHDMSAPTSFSSSSASSYSSTSVLSRSRSPFDATTTTATTTTTTDDSTNNNNNGKEKEKEGKGRCRLGAGLSRKRRRSSAATVEKEREERGKKARCVREEDGNGDGDAWRRTAFVYGDEAREEQHHRSQGMICEEDEDDMEGREDRDEDEGGERKDHEDCVPTCALGLRRQWQALSLRIRFGMFRAERRIKKRVQSLI